MQILPGSLSASLLRQHPVALPFSGQPRGTCLPKSSTAKPPVVAALPAGFQDWLDSLAFENWAPRSSRQWRLRPVPGEAEIKSDPEEDAEADVFSTLREQLSTSDAVAATSIEATSVSGLENEQLSASLSQRLQSFASAGSVGGEEEAELTGTELRRLICAKYGKSYDLSIVRRDIPGKTLIRLNVMWTHLEQRSFSMTPMQYMDKLESIAYYVRCWRQEDAVRAFFRQPPKAQRGLPARPTVGSAISIRLELDDAVIEEWFGRS